MNRLLLALVAVSLTLIMAPVTVWADEAPTDQIAAQVEPLLAQLAADSSAERDAARDALVELAGETTAEGEDLLAALPESNPQMPPAMTAALEEVRTAVSAQLSELAAAPSEVTLDVIRAPLDEVLASIEEQTGNRLLDYREKFGQETDERLVSVSLDAAPFWRALDDVLDEAGMTLYGYAGEPALALVTREAGSAARGAAADYAGPLRVEATRIVAARNLRRVGGETLTVEMEFAWEPRLHVIALSLPMEKLEATTTGGESLVPEDGQTSIDIEAQPGSQIAELTLPLDLPNRSDDVIATLAGVVDVLAPARLHKFEFSELTAADPAAQPATLPATQQRGDVTVTLDDVRRGGQVWEVHMRMQVENVGDALASHRGWVFNNRAYLVDAEGQVIEHVGFETTMQRKNEIGVAYLFDVEDNDEDNDGDDDGDDDENDDENDDGGDLEGMTWVYETPTAILRFPAKFELAHLPLP